VHALSGYLRILTLLQPCQVLPFQHVCMYDMLVMLLQRRRLQALQLLHADRFLPGPASLPANPANHLRLLQSIGRHPRLTAAMRSKGLASVACAMHLHLLSG